MKRHYFAEPDFGGFEEGLGALFTPEMGLMALKVAGTGAAGILAVSKGAEYVPGPRWVKPVAMIAASLVGSAATYGWDQDVSKALLAGPGGFGLAYGVSQILEAFGVQPLLGTASEAAQLTDLLKAAAITATAGFGRAQVQETTPLAALGQGVPRSFIGKRFSLGNAHVEEPRFGGVPGIM